jgi:hypothetical protein
MHLDPSAIIKLLDWLYEKAINGAPGLGTVEDLAEDYLKSKGSLHDRVSSLIRWQTAKSATSGFLAGLGGILLLPATLPANVISIIFVQVADDRGNSLYGRI